METKTRFDILKFASELSDAIFTAGAATTVSKVLNEDIDGARKCAKFTRKAAVTSAAINVTKIVVDVIATKKASSAVVEEVTEEEVNEEVEEDE